MSRALWLSPENEVIGVDYHPEIRCKIPELGKVWDEVNNTNDFMNKLFRMGWIRFRCYGYGVHINGTSLTKPHLRGRIRKILLYGMEHSAANVKHETSVTLCNSKEGPYGPRYEPDPKYTVAQLLGG